MNTIRNAIESVRGTISDALSTPELHTVSRSEVAAMEETERASRLESLAQSSIQRGNAQRTSALISSLNFPVFKGGLNKGFKQYTRRAEEMERQRLLASKQELALRKTNARLMSSGINALGWPFIRNAGPKFIFTDATKLAEEEERDRRVADKGTMMTSRNNAALVSNLIRWDNYQKHTTSGLKRMTRNWEEKERKDRMNDKGEQERAADLAWQTSGLIRRLGWPFYVQPTLDNKDFTKSLEEQERSLRLINPHERMMARENSGLVANLIHGKDAAYLEEKEKERRLQDTLEQQRHKDHSKKISTMVAKQYDPSELERKRLLADKTYSREAQLGAKKIAEMVPHVMSVSSWSINRAVEKERSRRLNDVTSTAFAKFNAKKVSQLILDSDFEKKNAWTNELEQERIRRMHDRLASDLSKKNARKVSKLILSNRGNSLNATESERARRINDLNEQQRHKLAAKKLSEIVLNKGQQLPQQPIAEDIEMGLPAGTGTRGLPEEFAAPASVPAPAPVSAPITRSRGLPAAFTAPAGYPATESILPSSSPMVEPISAGSRGVPSGYPVNDTQMPYLQQQQPAPMYSSPSAMPMNYTTSPSTMPMNYATSPSTMPVSYAPMVYSSPSAMPITYSSPSALPVTYRSSPSTLPINYSSVPHTTYLPGAAPAYVPYDSAVPSHLRTMTDRERKRLEKQASRHSRSSAKEARRAEHDLAKAEKLHFRGRDDRALRYESKAEQHNVAAKHHQAWAQELAADSLAHTLPSALPTVYRPAM